MSKMGVGMLVFLMMGSGVESSFDFEEAELENDETMWKLYSRWQHAYNLSRNKEEKVDARFKHFKENARSVNAFNKKTDKSYTMALNMFSDMTSEELKAGGCVTLGKKNAELEVNSTGGGGGGFMYQNLQSVPSSIDWRKKGAVITRDVKKNVHCGSCWAIAAAGAVEGINQIKTKKLVALSVQELVDCVGGKFGCKGGLPNEAFKFIVKKGLTTDKNYHYEDRRGICQSNKVNSSVATINGHQFVPPNDEEMLMKAVSNQPVAVLMDASKAFKNYKSGVFTGPCKTTLNHVVLLVGYGETPAGLKYWIGKNSWGRGWGERGFFKIKRGTSKMAPGLCGLATKAVYPLKN